MSTTDPLDRDYLREQRDQHREWLYQGVCVCGHHPVEHHDYSGLQRFACSLCRRCMKFVERLEPPENR